MNTVAKIKKLFGTALITSLVLPGYVSAAPGTLADSPLFLSTAVEPNIFWTLDDSGSMDWELITAGGYSGLPDMGGWSSNYYILPSANNDYDEYWISHYGYYPYTIDSEAVVSGAWKVRNSSFNVLYYNPEVTYSPWAGTDALGSPMFSDATETAALVNPMNAADGTLDLTASLTFKNWNPTDEWHDDTIYPAKYYTWADDDNDGVVEDTDTHTLVEIKSANAPFTGSVNRTDCVSAPSCTYAEEIQNFANWYQYYRKREYVAKAAIGSLVQGNNASRMGMQVFNSGLIASVTSMSSPADKISLLNTVYGQNMPCLSYDCPGTPARTSLKSVGDLFEGASSPILSAASGGTCQQNFNILITDGYWNGVDPGVGNTDIDGAGEFDGGSYEDAYSDTLADVAMHYYERDLKTTIDDEVPTTPGVDEADHQHIVTYAVAFGVTGTLDPETDDPTADTFSWTNPLDGDLEKVDDLWHTAHNGRGVFLSAQNPEELSSSLTSALEDIDDRAGSAAAVAFNTNTLTTGSAVFLVLFNSNRWSGSVYKYALDPITGAVSDTITWEASDVLDDRNLTSDPRQIITFDGSDGIPFQWANITAAQKNDLKMNPAGGVDSDTIGEARLNYIRGDRTNESAGYNFRTRSSRFGDIVHSNPVFVGSPAMDWPNTAPFPVDVLWLDPLVTTYSEWKATSVSSRESMLYVGSNDGMVHGIRTSDGQEMFAYIPSAVFSTSASEGLHYLTDPTYIHKYYVDLSPTISDAYVKIRPLGLTNWRTLLIGGQRAGGKSIYALDITDPTALTEANAADIVLWEFTDSELGYTFSEPTVAMMNNGKWAVIFGNGYNSTGSGESQLFILYIEDGLDGTWGVGDYLTISTESDCSGGGNGLSTPAVVDLDGNGTADRVYAGDLCGDMWVFDISDSSDSNWDIAYTHGGTPKPLFDGDSSQPITVEPLVSEHPDGISGGGPDLMVYFGTGQYLVSGDKTTTDTQAFYGVWDEGIKELEVGNLVQQTFEGTFDSDQRVLTNNSVPYNGLGGTDKYGWYIEMPSSGERVVVNPTLRGNIVYFNTLIPSIDPCTYGGSGWLMGVNASNGGRPDTEDQIFDTNGDGVIDSSDLLTNAEETLEDVVASGMIYGGGIPAESAFLGDYQYTPGTDTDDGSDIQVNKVQSLGGADTGRLSWEEINLE